MLLVSVAAAAPLSDLDWLVGAWRGEHDGVVYEEVWHPPLAGAMLGTFRMARGETIAFYEIMTIDAEELRIKHFGADLAGWEPRKRATRFAVTEADPDHVVFVGEGERLMYSRHGDALVIWLEKGGERVATFELRRVR